jgi:phosphinothricin acetyltransferase
MGFDLFVAFHKCGYKFGRWYGIIWIEKIIGEHNSLQADVKFGEWRLL